LLCAFRCQPPSLDAGGGGVPHLPA
jgi:hypothetical protein